MATEETQTKRRSAKERRAAQTSEAITERVREARRNRGLVRETELLREDVAAFEQGGDGPENPSRQQRRAQEQCRVKLGARTLRLMTRNDAAVRAILERKGKLSGMMSAEMTTEWDEILWLIVDDLKLLPALESLAPGPTRYDEKTGKEVRRRQMHAPVLLNLLGILSRFIGAATNPELHSVMLTDERWMTLLGFNAQEVANGATRRSVSLTGKTREGAGGRFVEADASGPVRARIEGPRGALSSQTLSGHESDLEPSALVETFNAFVRALAAQGFFPKRLRASLDSTGVEVVPSFEDAGQVRKKVKVQSKARRPRQVEVSVRGFKIWYVMDVTSGLPVAMTLDKIERSELGPARALIDQARSNLEGHSELVSCAVDRGFLDGDYLWWLEQERQIEWVCPSKEPMHVTREARERVSAALLALSETGESEVETAQRAARRSLGHDGVRFFERSGGAGRESLLVAEVDELKETDFYGSGGSTSSRVHSKSFRPRSLFGTVVLRWPDRHASMRMLDGSEKGPLVLLSASEEAPLGRYDRYDERSLIENRLNRDAKQHFGLGASLARNERSMWSGAVFSTLALLLYRALEIRDEEAQEALDRRAERLGVLRYRRQVELGNRGKVIVTAGTEYGIFTYYEFGRSVGLDLG